MWPAMAVLGLVFWANDGSAQQNPPDKLMTGFTRNTVTKYKVLSEAPYTLQRDGNFDASTQRAGLNWEIKKELDDGRVVVKTPGGLVGFDGTQVKTNATDSVKSCSAVPSLGVKSRNLSSQGLNECPK